MQPDKEVDLGVITQSRASSISSSPTLTPKSSEERLTVAVRIRPLKNSESTRVLRALGPKTRLVFRISNDVSLKYGHLPPGLAVMSNNFVPSYFCKIVRTQLLLAAASVVLEDDADKSDVLRQKRAVGERRYAYDSVFPEESSQEAVYEATTRGLVRDVLSGYNATVFAYGATGSGKTHTMVGNPRQPGIMVRALNDLFKAVGDAPHPDRYEVTMSYLEIYNENIRDLLNPDSGFLELREDSRGRNIQVARLTEISTTSTEEVMNLLQRGNRARTVESTAANKTSSRSHALLSVTVRQTAPLAGQSRNRVKQGRLFMIDLAGSERAANTKNQGKRLQEGAHINRSLLALGNCITALCGGARYVNYRDSKLTRLLKEALSGNCRTVMVAHVSPAAKHRDESKQTLLYAERANNISNKVERNVLDVSYHVNQYQTVISELREEIDRLRGKMAEERPRQRSVKVATAERRQGPQIKHLREQIVSTFKEQMRLRRKLMDLDGQLLSLGAEAEKQHQLISQWESRNNKLYKNNNTNNNSRNAKNGNSKWHINMEESEEKDSSDGDASEDLQRAWIELAAIEREQEKHAELRESIERELEDCRQRGAVLEEELPSQISTEEESELLALMLRCHELEVEKMALQSERLTKQHELRKRDIVILRYDRQRQLCETIITRQRELMEEGCIKLPPDLQELYRLYQQEIHAASYTDISGSNYQSAAPYKSKLPPISQSVEPLFQRSMRVTADDNMMGFIDSEIHLRTPTSSADGSDASSPLPPISSTEADRLGHSSQLPPPAVLFPPISDPRGNRTDVSPRRASRLPVPSQSRRYSPSSDDGMRRIASDDNISLSSPEKKTRTRSRFKWGR